MRRIIKQRGALPASTEEHTITSTGSIHLNKCPTTKFIPRRSQYHYTCQLAENDQGIKKSIVQLSYKRIIARNKSSKKAKGYKLFLQTLVQSTATSTYHLTKQNFTQWIISKKQVHIENFELPHLLTRYEKYKEPCSSKTATIK